LAEKLSEGEKRKKQGRKVALLCLSTLPVPYMKNPGGATALP